MRSRGLRRFGWIGSLALLVIVGSGTAIAGSGPRMDDVMAVFSADQVSSNFVPCTGEDGEYIQAHETEVGTQTSADPRLSGETKFEIDVLVNEDTGDGILFGTQLLRDPSTGDKLARGFFVGVIDNGVQAKGQVNLRLADGSFLLGTFNVVVDPATGHVDGEIGSDAPAVSIDPAVIWNGSACAEAFLANLPAGLGSL